ncbi:MAG: hypothetical protein OXE85_09455 [Roseovarius sp.]|nr:hypothetical protein [Roseovarius sp.]
MIDAASLYRIFSEHFGLIVPLIIVFTIWGTRWITRVDSDRENFKEFMREIKEDVKGMREDIKRIFERLPPPKVVDSASPLKLTEYGRQISDLINAQEWAKTFADKHVKDFKDKEGFEIYDISKDFVEKESGEGTDLGRKVKRAAYEMGTTVDKVRTVLAVELRTHC